MNSGGRLGPAARALVLVLMACGSSLAAIALGVAVFSWANGARLERRVLETAARQGVSAETFNVYYFGSSTMVGEPYAPQASIPRIVDAVLGGTVKGRPLRSVNLGQAGADLADSVDRLTLVMRNQSVTHPSLVVIYEGHNEFLKFDGRMVRAVRKLPAAYIDLAQRFDGLWRPLEIDQRRFLDESVIPETERQAVIESFRSQLDEVLARLASSGIPAIVSTQAGNYADWEPNRSVCKANVVPESFGQQVELGYALESRGDFRGAVAEYREALAICDSVAELHFRVASCLRQLGESAAAWDEFERAVDEDGMPLRAGSAINTAIRQLDGRRLVTVVDAVSRLRELSPQGLIGSNVMSDGHHPNLRGYLAIGTLIAQTIRERFDDPSQPLQPIADEEAAARFGIDAHKRFEIAVSRGRWFTRLATWRYDPLSRLESAEERFREAMALEPQRYEPTLGLGMVQFLRGDASGGDRFVAKARELDAGEVDRYLADDWVRQIRDRARRGPVSTSEPGRGGRHSGGQS